MIDLTPIFQAIVALVAVLITTRLIPWIQSKTTKNQQEALITAARIAVLAAEHVFGSGAGQEKLQSAISTEEKSQLLAEYYDWEWNFPKGLIAETSKGMKKAAIKSRIEDLQDELKKLEDEDM